MIEYKNVALRYTEKDVLRDVNLQIERWGIYGFSRAFWIR